MRVTNLMLTQGARADLDVLRSKYAKAQDALNGRALDRPSEDPQRVMEAMDLAGLKERLARAERSGQDARDWLGTAETSISTMIDHLQSVREIVVQSGSPSAQDPTARESFANQVDLIRKEMMRLGNSEYQGHKLFAGHKTSTAPFVDDPVTGGVTYQGDSGQIGREVAPGLTVSINVPGSDLLSGHDFFKTLSDFAKDLRTGNQDANRSTYLSNLDSALNKLTTIRSDLGMRYQQIQQYEDYARDAQVRIEDRMGQITGVDLERAVLDMSMAQAAYQTALASFARALPPTLLDFMK